MNMDIFLQVLALMNLLALVVVFITWMNWWLYPNAFDRYMDRHKVLWGTIFRKNGNHFLPTIDTRFVPIDQAIAKGSDGCPESIIVRRKLDAFNYGDLPIFEIELYSHQSPKIEFHKATSAVSFYYDVSLGRIFKIIVYPGFIKYRGVTNCSNGDWPKYINSVVMAHIEILKHSSIRKHNTSLVFRIFRNYGENIFQGA